MKILSLIRTLVVHIYLTGYNNSYSDILMNNLVQSLKSKSADFKEHANQLKNENEKLNELDK